MGAFLLNKRLASIETEFRNFVRSLFSYLREFFFFSLASFGFLVVVYDSGLSLLPKVFLLVFFACLLVPLNVLIGKKCLDERALEREGAFEVE